MKTALLVEDRDTAFLFLDAENAHSDAAPMEFTLALGVLFCDVENDEKVVWLASNETIRVVPRETVDFENDPFESEWPIPPAVIVLTVADYEAFLFNSA